MLLGGFVAAAWFFMGNPYGISCLWPGAALTLVAVFGISLFGKNRELSGYEEYHQILRRFDALEQQDMERASRKG